MAWGRFSGKYGHSQRRPEPGPSLSSLQRGLCLNGRRAQLSAASTGPRPISCASAKAPCFWSSSQPLDQWTRGTRQPADRRAIERDRYHPVADAAHEPGGLGIFLPARDVAQRRLDRRPIALLIGRELKHTFDARDVDRRSLLHGERQPSRRRNWWWRQTTNRAPRARVRPRKSSSSFPIFPRLLRLRGAA